MNILWIRIGGPGKTFARFAALLLVALTAACAGTGPQPSSAVPKNIIILFADGAAPVQWELGRYSSAQMRSRPFAVTDTIFRQGTLGLMSTYSHDAYVTDSAAAASAMSTGMKVLNGAISITPDGKSPRTVMEAARAQGKRIGLVSTAAIHDASPAAFSVHAKSRRESQAIVDQYLALEPDVLLGGGSDYFLSAPAGKRKDGKDVTAQFRAKGYDVVKNASELKAATGTKLLGLFADEDMDYVIDRSPEQPSFVEMTAAALRVLERNSPNGFVLFVENENTDSAGHMNDIAALIRELWVFDEAVEAALAFQRRNPDTLILVTGDHETGGLSPTYALKDLSSIATSNRFYTGKTQFEMVSRITISLGEAAEKLGKKPTAEALDRLVAEHFPGFRLDADLREAILQQRALERNFGVPTQHALSRMVARQTGFYWGTGGHTPEPVAVGALGPGQELFKGYQDNTDFARNLYRLIESK
jgi:alkaline phosphatase